MPDEEFTLSVEHLGMTAERFVELLRQVVAVRLAEGRTVSIMGRLIISVGPPQDALPQE